MKKFAIIIILILAMVILSGCEWVEGGMQILDTTYRFDRAVVDLGNGRSAEGKVDSWLDYENSDVIQVVIDGTTYLTHYSNVVLIAE